MELSDNRVIDIFHHVPLNFLSPSKSVPHYKIRVFSHQTDCFSCNVLDLGDVICCHTSDSSEFLYDMPPIVADEWLAFVHHIQEVLGSDIGPET